MGKLGSFSLFLLLLLPRGGCLSSPGHKRQPPATGISFADQCGPNQRFLCSATGRPRAWKPPHLPGGNLGGPPRGAAMFYATLPSTRFAGRAGWLDGSSSAEVRRGESGCLRWGRTTGEPRSGSLPALFFPGQASKARRVFFLGARLFGGMTCFFHAFWWWWFFFFWLSRAGLYFWLRLGARPVS